MNQPNAPVQFPQLPYSSFWEQASVVISGPSGVGKSSLAKKLPDEFPWLEFSISHTTRAPRVGEVDGRDYHFLTKTKFQALKGEGAFLEDAVVHGNYYGTSVQELKRIRDRNHTPLLEVDFQGAMSIKSRETNSVMIMILPPSFDVLRQRLSGRKTETEEVQQRRLQRAREELDAYLNAKYDFFVVNDDYDETFQALCSLIQSLPHQVKYLRDDYYSSLLEPKP